MINVSRDKSVLTIEIDRPQKKNALVPQMYTDMALAIESASDGDIKVVLIKGSHGCFTAGNDISDFMAKGDKQEVNETLRFMMSLVNCPVPIVAQVEGLAIGIGTTLLLHCDFVYCGESAKFAMPFINLGLVPEYASSYILPRIAGNLTAAELLLLGETFDAKKACDCGIVSQVLSDERLSMKVNETVSKLALKPQAALIQTKALLRKQNADIEKHIIEELQVFAKAMVSEPAKEAFSAFLEKRQVNRALFK